MCMTISKSYACDQYPIADITTPGDGAIYRWIDDPSAILFTGTGIDPDNGYPPEEGQGITQCEWWLYSYQDDVDHCLTIDYDSSSSFYFYNNYSFNPWWYSVPGHYEMELFVLGDDSYVGYYDYSSYPDYYDYRDVYLIDAVFTSVQEYVPYGAGNTFKYYLLPGSGWEPSYVTLYIKDDAGNCAYLYLDTPPISMGTEEYPIEIAWNGIGNLGSYSGVTLPPGSYTAYFYAYKAGAHIEKEIQFTIVKVDLDTDIDGDGDIDNDDDPGEENPGGYIVVGGQRKRINLNVWPFADLYYGYVVIEITEDSEEKAKIYTSPTIGSPYDYLVFDLSSGTEHDILQAVINNGLYIQGIDASSNPQDIEVTLTYYDASYYPPEPVYVDTVNFTALELEVYIDEDKTVPLEDWPEFEDIGFLRSPKYFFGSNNPIYVVVKNLGTNGYTAEQFTDVVKVTSESGGLACLTLKETGPATNEFDNIAALGELLYLSNENSSGASDKIKVMTEEVLTFSLEIPPGSGNYEECFDVMVDRAEMGVEYQDWYTRDGHVPGLPDVPCHAFGQQLYDNIGGSPFVIWYKNFVNTELDSKKFHWQWEYDEYYADSVDLVSWSGHSYGGKWAFYKDNSGNLDLLDIASYEVHLGDTDAEWVIFDTCYSLMTHLSDENPANPSAILETLKDWLLNESYYDPSIRNAHMFLGFKSPCYTNYVPEDGVTFAQHLKHYDVKTAWKKYVEDTQPASTTGRIFYAVNCQYDGFDLSGGPGFAGRDPLYTDTWAYENIPVSP